GRVDLWQHLLDQPVQGLLGGPLFSAQEMGLMPCREPAATGDPSCRSGDDGREGEQDEGGDGECVHQTLAATRTSASAAGAPAPSCCNRSADPMTPMWLYACGKLPSCRPLVGSYSSASRPRSVRRASSRSNSARASSRRPVRASASTIMNEQRRKVPSFPVRPSIPVRFPAVRYRCTKPSGVDRSRRTASTVPITRGSSGGRKPTRGIGSRAASTSCDP